MKLLVRSTRFLIIIPILGLMLTAAFFFAIGGLGLFSFLLEAVQGKVELRGVEVLPIVEVLEFVHQFLIGTVLYMVSLGFYQLFIQQVDLPEWLKVDSTEELETNLIGVTIVVLAIHFLGVVFAQPEIDLLRYGGGVALVVGALAFFIWVRTSVKPEAKK